MKRLNVCKAPAAVILAVLILMGCTAMTGRQSVSEAYDDTAITAKVKSSLIADSVVGASAIDVDTLEGTVSLNGIVTSEQQRQRAIQVARSTQGVKQVDARNLMVRRQ
jgi:osmotically-inducible protein OsmY